jgi:hypothetical protein
MYPIRLIYNFIIITYAKHKSNTFFKLFPVYRSLSQEPVPSSHPPEIDCSEMYHAPNNLEKQYRYKFDCIKTSHQCEHR